MTTCEEMMTQTPFCCLTSDKVYMIAQRMQTEDIGALPVVDDNDSKNLVGMITDRDLAIRVVGAGRDATDTIVGDVMSPSPVACHTTDELNVVLAMMSTHQIRRVPIVNENGMLVGIITQADLAIHMKDHDKVGLLVNQISQPDVQPDVVTAP